MFLRLSILWLRNNIWDEMGKQSKFLLLIFYLIVLGRYFLSIYRISLLKSTRVATLEMTKKWQEWWIRLTWRLMTRINDVYFFNTQPRRSYYSNSFFFIFYLLLLQQNRVEIWQSKLKNKAFYFCKQAMQDIFYPEEDEKI